ncbi:YjjG family noncanonical pyrimidine nucleotidase [Mycoplasma sp. P36-A1]|uniref:YjjG family noncanonical pyrimidine nucleotidase n=1 Tax=Mycoplasma sp. P36-A1 TaxID=3252900 RepID=UPI003C2C4E78
MKKYKFLLFDLDDTLLDFHKAEYHGIKNVMLKYNLDFDEKKYAIYNTINHKYWSMFEKNLIDQKQVLKLRFEEFFLRYNIKVDGKEVDDYYRLQLQDAAYVIPGAMQLLQNLNEKYEIYAATNGVGKTQYSRLVKSKMINYFNDLFISQEIGFNKPDINFFEYCFTNIKNFDKKSTLMIGDSLQSDIKGGIDSGIDTCWYNPNIIENTTDFKATYEIDNLQQILSILK